MTDDTSIQKLQELIGYEFRDTDIIEKARTRIAFLNDQQKCDEKNSMGPLATVGDAVLSCIVAGMLYSDESCRTRQKITELRSKEVRHERTRAFAEKNHLGDFVLWGKGEKNLEIEKKGTNAGDTVTEALIGAVFLDAQDQCKNGINEVERMLERMKFFD